MTPSLSPLPSSEDVSAAASRRAQPRHGAVKGLARGLTAALVISAPLLLSGCGYNEFQNLDEQVNASWSEVLSQYQRRSDLIPNIVNTVKGEANFEQETLTRVVEAHAKATSIQVTPELAKDPEALKRALGNLIDNAVEAMQSSLLRELRITTCQLENGTVELTIADTGSGLTDEMRERLFLPYFSTKQRGTGLGLAIAGKIIQEHQGTIRAEKNVPIGARFIIELRTASEVEPTQTVTDISTGRISA